MRQVSGVRKYVMAGLLAFAAIVVGYAQQRPNIIFILGDDMGYQSIGAFGQQKIKTPNLDKLASNGMKLTRFYTNHLCSPSRGSLLTGFHTGNGMIRGNHELGGFADSLEFGQMPLPLNISTLGSELKKAGYATAVMGKWGLGGPGSTGAPHLHGIDLFYGYLDQKQAHNYYPTHLWRNTVWEPLPNDYFSPHQELPTHLDPYDDASYAKYTGTVYAPDTIASEAIKFIKENSHQPFFLEMAFTLPHMALQVPASNLEQYKGKFDDVPYKGGSYLPNRYPRATYAAMISLLDEYVGQLMDALEECGIAEQTLVVFTADNGAAVAGGCDPDYFDCSGGLRGRKGTIYEGGIKVPFIAHWPGSIKKGSVSDHLCAIWDLMPTFLDVAEAREHPVTDGISFLPTLLDSGSKQQQHEFLYWESHQKGDKRAQAVRFGDWKAIKKINKNTIELYYLKDDEGEMNNVASANPDLVVKAEAYFQTRKVAVIPEWNYVKPTEQH